MSKIKKIAIAKKNNVQIELICQNKKRQLLLADMLKQINIFESRIELMQLEIK